MSSSAPKHAILSFRSISLFFLVLLVLYSVFGVFFVPKIVESQLQENLKTYAKWDTYVEQIRFNPFALSLEVKGAKVTEVDNTEVLRFDRLFIDVSVLNALKGEITFDEVSLNEPVVHLTIDQTGKTNFQKAFASDEPEPETTEEQTESSPLALSFELIAINAGKLNVSDQSQGEAFEFSLTPLTVSLEAFATHKNEGGMHSLTASLGDNQQIKWQGNIGIAPFQSSGHISLSNIHSSAFWHYAKAKSPYWLNEANITFTGDYSTQVSATATEFLLENSALVIDDIILSESPDQVPFFSVNQVSLAPIRFDLAALALSLGQIAIKQPNIVIERAADGSLNILRPLQTQVEAVHEASLECAEPECPETLSATSNENEADTSSTSPAFHWEITNIALSNGTFLWRDQMPETAVEMGLSHVELELGKLSQDLSQLFPYALRFSMNADAQSRVHQISGQLSPHPFYIEGKAEIDQFDLVSLQPYLSEHANLNINQGFFSLQSDYQLSLADRAHGMISLRSQLDKLSVQDAVLDKVLAGFHQLDIGPVSVSLPESDVDPIKIDIEQITLDQPSGEIFVAENGELNLKHLSKTKASDAKVSSVDTVEEASANKPKAELFLAKFELKSGNFSYTDNSLAPAFTTQLSSLSGEIEGLSSDVNAKSKVNFSGKVDNQGGLAIRGTLNPLSNQPNTDLTINVNNVNMSIASPYSAKYAGYLIDKGKLDLDLNYLINGNKLKAENEISLKQFEFGKSVDSPDATSLPLPLAIGILKDRKGNIDIDLPISGKLDDPSFKLSSVIINTFVNLITKAVTSPFAMLGSLVEGEDDISEIEFNADSSQLDEQQEQRVLALAKALKERPNLTLEIRGIADANLELLNQVQGANAELIKLAKARAQVLHDLLVSKGNIDAKRVFILEPDVIPRLPADPKTAQAAETAATTPVIHSKFTLGVR